MNINGHGLPSPSFVAPIIRLLCAVSVMTYAISMSIAS